VPALGAMAAAAGGGGVVRRQNGGGRWGRVGHAPLRGVEVGGGVALKLAEYLEVITESLRENVCVIGFFFHWANPPAAYLRW